MNHTSKRHRFAVHALACAAALCASGAQAGELETGNPDLSIRFDNTVKYNMARRTEGQDASILNSPNSAFVFASFELGEMPASSCC